MHHQTLGSSMKRPFITAIAVAVLSFVALFGLRLGYGYLNPGGSGSGGSSVTFWDDGIVSIARKNYASEKKGPVVAVETGSFSQKYEKIATMSQGTRAFDDDKAKIDALIQEKKGQVQLERADGLTGSRILYLGIGVPPEAFDPFIEALRKIGTSSAITIVKNDKTNDYLQLRASRATLEKARASLEELRATGGSVADRVEVQTRLTEIEEKIQAMGVSLGEFDSQNEFVTVRVILNELQATRRISLVHRLYVAFSWTVETYAILAAGLALASAAFWALFLLIGVVRRQASAATP
jgi:uncharacterized protein YfcZ (UPF0381/DUF406 family)